MRYIGLDLGTKTLGIAISDQSGLIASTYKTIRYEDEEILKQKLLEIINEKQIDKIVLGLPKNMNNSIGQRAEQTIKFKEDLEKITDKEIILQDERLTTIAAHNYMIEANISRKKRKQKVDSLAANIILQTYLDKEGN